MSYSSRRARSEIKSESSDPIEIIHYSTLLQESINKNGTIKQIHWVVKNSPFSLRLRANNIEDWSWADTKVHCVVLSEASGKPIEMPKTEPIMWHLTCAPGIATESTLTIRLFPLSSSLENSFLIVRVELSCGDKAFSFETLPFKTVSKHEQVDRKKKELGLISDEEDEEDLPPSKKNPKKRKQNTTETLFNELTELREQNERMYEMLQVLSARMRTTDSSAFAVAEPALQPPAPKRPKLVVAPVPISPKVETPISLDAEMSDEDSSLHQMSIDSPADSFVFGFSNLLSAFASMSDSDRQTALQQLSLQNSSINESAQLLSDGLVRYGLAKADSCYPQHCSHKAELDKVLQIYNADAGDAHAVEDFSGTDDASADHSLFDTDFPAPSLYNSSSTLMAYDTLF
jgi:hypothetical protein